ncbi:unnamed protein product [Zymoseptoria tritici ST99CH_3D1]|nr:unnamed protein product [Zymoseptoria tritici ST99CH_3D1]
MASSTAYGCTQCSFTASSLHGIDAHVGTSNQEMELWRCPGCGLHFCRAAELKNHFTSCHKFGTWRTTAKWGRDLDNNARVKSACSVTVQRAGATAGRTSTSQSAGQPAAAPSQNSPPNTAPSKAAVSRRAPLKRAPPKKTYDNGQQQTGKRRKRGSEQEQSDDDGMPVNEDISQTSPPSKRTRNTRNAVPRLSPIGPVGTKTLATNTVFTSWPSWAEPPNEIPSNTSPTAIADREAWETAYANAELQDSMFGNFGAGGILGVESDEPAFGSLEAVGADGLSFEQWNACSDVDAGEHVEKGEMNEEK